MFTSLLERASQRPQWRDREWGEPLLRTVGDQLSRSSLNSSFGALMEASKCRHNWLNHCHVLSAQPCRLTGRPAPTLGWFGSILEASYGHSTEMNPIASEDTVNFWCSKDHKNYVPRNEEKYQNTFHGAWVYDCGYWKTWSKQLPRALGFHP